MAEAVRYTLEEAHKEFARRANGQVWKLLEKADRTLAENEEMELAAFACLYHWMYAGEEVHHQRGEWLIARVYTVLGDTAHALKHANRCLLLTEQYPSHMQDFDMAYAYEGIARANALGGDRGIAARYLQMARAAGEAITNAEDKQIFMGDLQNGEWYGI